MPARAPAASAAASYPGLWLRRVEDRLLLLGASGCIDSGYDRLESDKYAGLIAAWISSRRQIADIHSNLRRGKAHLNRLPHRDLGRAAAVVAINGGFF